MNEGIEQRQKGLENLILLVLGATDKKISVLHLEKEVFLLWNFHPKIRDYLSFIKHYKGPFSKEIQETIKDPLYLENHWTYVPPKRGDKLSGGFVGLTPMGREEYKRLEQKIKERNDELIHLLAGIKIVRELYDKLTMEELLFLIYDTYPDYIEKSNVYKDIECKKSQLVENLIKKGVMDRKNAKRSYQKRRS